MNTWLTSTPEEPPKLLVVLVGLASAFFALLTLVDILSFSVMSLLRSLLYLVTWFSMNYFTTIYLWPKGINRSKVLIGMVSSGTRRLLTWLRTKVPWI